MDKVSKWAIAGSFAWLVMAVGVILGTHGVRLGPQTIEAQDASPSSATIGRCYKA